MSNCFKCLIWCLKKQMIGRHMEKKELLKKEKNRYIRFVNVRITSKCAYTFYAVTTTPNNSVRFWYNLILFLKYQRRKSSTLHRHPFLIQMYRLSNGKWHYYTSVTHLTGKIGVSHLFHTKTKTTNETKMSKVYKFRFIPTIHNTYCDGRYVIKRMKFVCVCVCLSHDNLSTNSSILFILLTKVGVCPD